MPKVRDRRKQYFFLYSPTLYYPRSQNFSKKGRRYTLEFVVYDLSYILNVVEISEYRYYLLHVHYFQSLLIIQRTRRIICTKNRYIQKIVYWLYCKVIFCCYTVRVCITHTLYEYENQFPLLFVILLSSLHWWYVWISNNDSDIATPFYIIGSDSQYCMTCMWSMRVILACSTKHLWFN